MIILEENLVNYGFIKEIENMLKNLLACKVAQRTKDLTHLPREIKKEAMKDNEFLLTFTHKLQEVIFSSLIQSTNYKYLSEVRAEYGILLHYQKEALTRQLTSDELDVMMVLYNKWVTILLGDDDLFSSLLSVFNR